MLNFKYISDYTVTGSLCWHCTNERRVSCFNSFIRDSVSSCSLLLSLFKIFILLGCNCSFAMLL